MNIFKTFAKLRHSILRSLSYISILNSVLIFLTFREVYSLNIPIYLIFVLGGLIILIIGIIDYKFILKHELEHLNKKNNMKQDLEEIKQLLQNK